MSAGTRAPLPRPSLRPSRRFTAPSSILPRWSLLWNLPNPISATLLVTCFRKSRQQMLSSSR
ncbi:unnamed protein product [Linum tenue]|uniref:Uncharacterized protein n=1 Tax=Linum tenue TaxID=586396 RepID=A0AAV0KER4_9ROSI|nr:unnamed protein product [Linum tenue]